MVSGYVVYDTLRGNDVTQRRKVRVDKQTSLEEAKRVAQLRYIRFARAPQDSEGADLESITVETLIGEIVYELPEPLPL